MNLFIVCSLACTATSLICSSCYCIEHQCDQGCLSPVCKFQAFQSLPECLFGCDVLSGSEICSAGGSNCEKCEQVEVDCGYCALGCMLHAGHLSQLGNGVCEDSCNLPSCGFDGKDCVVLVTIEASDLNVSPGTESLSHAILQSANSTVLISLREGKHPLLPVQAVANFSIYQSLSIESAPLNASEVPSNKTFPVIQLAAEPVTIHVYGHLSLRNLVIEGGFSLVTDCEKEACKYCPNAVFDEKSGEWKDDRNNSLHEFAPQSACDYYQDSVLFSLHPGSSLVLINTTFMRISHQPKALIYSECGDLYLQNVVFSGVTMRRSGSDTGVVVHSSGKVRACGSVTYIGGTVELLNNGFEITDGSPFSGFGLWMNAESVSMIDVQFRLNLALSNSTDVTALVMIQEVPMSIIDNCVFDANMMGSAVIEVECSTTGGSQVVTITNTIFRSNLGILSGAVMISDYHCNSQISISNCAFVENYAQVFGILCFEINKDLFKDFELIFAGEVILLNITATKNYSSKLTHFTGFHRVTIDGLTAQENGDYPDALSRVINTFIDAPEVYMISVPSLSKSVCIGTIYLYEVQHTIILNSNFTACHCSFGSPGLTQAGPSSSVQISNLRFTDNEGEELIALDLASDLHLTNLHFEGNLNHRTNQAVCMRFTASQALSIAITDSSFLGNRGYQNVIASVTGIKNFTMVRALVVNNSAVRSSAGVVFCPYPQEGSFLTVAASRFEGNTALANGVVSIIDSIGGVFSEELRVRLHITNSVFIGNSAAVTGSCVTISGFIQLDRSSQVANCTFEQNSCAGGGVALYSNSHKLFPSTSSRASWALLTIYNSLFLSNSGSSVVTIVGDTFRLKTVNCTFKQSVGVSLQLSSGWWSDSLSSFLGNVGLEAGAAQLSQGTVATARNTSFTGNYGKVHGGAVSILLNTLFVCIDCTFQSNACDKHGGGLNIEESSAFFGSRVVFRNNSAGSNGAAFSAIFSLAACDLCLLEGNFAESYVAAFLISTVANLTRSTIRSNTATFTPSLMISHSQVTIEDCTLWNQTGTFGAFIFVTDKGELTVRNSRFREGRADHFGACVYSTVNSTVAIYHSDISQSTSGSFGNAVMVRAGTLLMLNVSIHDVVSDLKVGSIAVIEGKATLVISCWNLQGSAIVASFSSVAIYDSQFLDITSYYGAALSCAECPSISAENSEFRGNLAKKGGALYIFSSGSNGINFASVFRNCTFASNRAVNGGAIYSESVYADIKNCYFLNNSVRPEYYPSVEILNRGIGGALYLVNANLVVSIYHIVNNRFVNNSASNMGACLYWFDTFPTYENNSFEGNEANYGAEVASFPIRLALVNDANSLEQYITEDDEPVVAALEEVASGQVYWGTIRLALVDQYDSIVSTNASSSAHITVIDNESCGLSGRVQVDSDHGIFQFSNITFIGPPGTTQYFSIHSQGVNTYLKTFTSDPSRYFDRVRLRVNFRDCEPGESYQGRACYLCTEGTFSLKPTQPCNSCPSAAICYGGFNLVPRKGYWRPDPALNLFFKCTNEDACIGSPAGANYSLTGDCDVGYSGNLCSVCIPGYSRSGKDYCRRCPSLTSNIVITSLVVAIALCFLALAVFFAIRGARKPRSRIAVYVKIFLNYVQMITLAASLDLNWPNLIQRILDGQQTIGNLTSQLFSIDCILQTLDLTSLHSTMAVLIAMIPGGLIALAVIFWVGLGLCRNITHIFSKVITTMVVTLFVLHPSLTKSLFSAFSCKELRPTEYWMAADLANRCWDVRHIRELLTITLPGLVVWSFGLPTVCFLYLIRFRNHLEVFQTRIKFSFLFKGYRREYFYWEFIVLYRKVALVCSSVFFSVISPNAQGLSVLAVLIVNLSLQLHIAPFHYTSYNRLETKSILVSLLTIFSGLYFDSYQRSKLHPDSGLSVGLFVVVVLANGYFVLSWARQVLPIIVETITQSCSREEDSSGQLPPGPNSSSDFSSVAATQAAVHPEQISLEMAIQGEPQLPEDT